MSEEFFKLLFEPDEGICTGDVYDNTISVDPYEAPFFCINPLDRSRDHGFFLKDRYKEDKPRRADLNVTCFRNFLFEMDGLPLDSQLDIFTKSSIPFSSIVYSGGKSMHAILSVDGGTCGDQHTLDGIYKYKHLWKRLAARINREAALAGYKHEQGSSSFVDESCKNPSRLSRYPGVLRDNGELQKLLFLTERISRNKFRELIDSCPKIEATLKTEFSPPEDQVYDLDHFQAICPPALRRKLKLVDWARSEAMYPVLYQYTLWAIDSTNVSKETFVEFLEKYTFKHLIAHGYPAHKLMTGVDHAFAFKGQV